VNCTKKTLHHAYTFQNYSDDIAKMYFIENGIYKDSIMNTIDSFHVTQYFCIDVMHDLYEGACHYDKCHLFKYYINTAQIFSLATLNNRKSNFNYGPIEIGNYWCSFKKVSSKNEC